MQKTILLLLFIALSACGGGGSGGDQNSDPQIGEQDPVDDANPEYVTPVGVAECSVEDINMRVDFDMRDYYIYYDQVPSLNLDDYSSPESLIRDLRVDPDIYSYVTDLQEQQNLATTGGTAGYGLAIAIAGDGLYHIREIRGGSPAEAAGILRGDEIVTIDGIPLEDYSAEERSQIFTEENSPVTMMVRTGTEEARSVSVAYAEYTWRTAGPGRRYTSTSNPDLPAVGYLPIRTFLLSTEAEIDQALATMQQRGGFTELVVDLRYNPGGRTSVARHIASVVGGDAVAEQVFLRRNWNDKYPENNSIDYFDTVDQPLNLPRVIVLVTGRSSSASEVFINALEPYMDVVVIGSVTGGKPFTSRAKGYCGKSINAMFSLRTNANLVSVAGGIQPDCAVKDDWLERQSSVRDPLLRAALNFVSTGGCTAIAADTPLARSASASGPLLEISEPEIFISEE